MTTDIELNKMRNLAFELLITERMMFSEEEKRRIDMIIINYGAFHVVKNPDWSDVIRQIEKDIRIYKKYDCLTMWLDSEYGLASYYPELIKRIAIEVGGIQEVKI